MLYQINITVLCATKKLLLNKEIIMVYLVVGVVGFLLGGYCMYKFMESPLPEHEGPELKP